MKCYRKERQRDNQKCPKCGQRKNKDQFPEDGSWCLSCEREANLELARFGQ